jgi:prophage regulatory protein
MSSSKILRLPEVRELTGKSRSSIYVDVKLGLFPRPVKLGRRAIGWLEADLAAWMDSRVAT